MRKKVVIESRPATKLRSITLKWFEVLVFDAPAGCQMSYPFWFVEQISRAAAYLVIEIRIGNVYSLLTMQTILTLSSAQLKQAAAIKEKIAGLEKQLSALLNSGAPAKAAAKAPKRRKISAAGLARIRAAQKARWAKAKAAKKA